MRRTTVVKCGGNGAVDPQAVCLDVAHLRESGQEVVLVHGGSADIDALAGRLGVPRRKLVAPDGVQARYTDPAMLEVVVLALAGLVKPRLVTALGRLGVTAVGLTGLDGGLIRARRKAVHRAIVDGRQMVVRDDHSGRVVSVDSGLLTSLMSAGIVPVVSPPVLAEDGRAVNADADRVAAAIAIALDAETLVMLTGAPGVLADVDDERTVREVYQVPAEGAPQDVSGGMALKLVAAREALVGGVVEALVADGRSPRPVTSALGGAGTRVVLEPVGAP